MTAYMPPSAQKARPQSPQQTAPLLGTWPMTGRFLILNPTAISAIIPENPHFLESPTPLSLTRTPSLGNPTSDQRREQLWGSGRWESAKKRDTRRRRKGDVGGKTPQHLVYSLVVSSPSTHQAQPCLASEMRSDNALQGHIITASAAEARYPRSPRCMALLHQASFTCRLGTLRPQLSATGSPDPLSSAPWAKPPGCTF